MQTDVLDWIALNLTPGIGPVIGRKLLNHFGFPGAVFRATRSQLESLGLKGETVASLIRKTSFPEAETQVAALERSGGGALTLTDEGYPDLLREIHDAPLVLYFKGALEAALAQPRVAVVGSRHCSTYGRNVTARISRDLAAHGLTVVSGMARGVDSAAHEAVLEVGGRTIAVLGTGLDDVYPKENVRLTHAIPENGALVSEFPFEKPPLPQNFPYRNRVISGMSLGVLVVEAAEQSGSLITARLALEQGREVFAVPGNITSGKSIGPNRLIQDGAKLVLDWRDVVAEFSYELRLLMKRGEDGTLSENADPEPELTDDERQVFRHIGLDAPVHIDHLFATAGISPQTVLSALLGLEMKEAVRELPGKYYVRKL